MKPLNTGGPPPRNANATVEGGVCRQTEQLGQANYDCTSDWRQGLGADLLSAVADHRRARPFEPLPAALQRDLARSWRLHAKGLR
jgi:hypothetical protein